MKNLFLPICQFSNVWSFLLSSEVNTKVYIISQERKLCVIDEYFNRINLWNLGFFQSLNRVNQEIWGFEYTQMKTIVFNEIQSNGEPLSYILIPVEGNMSSVICLCMYRFSTERGYAFVDKESKRLGKKYPLNYGLNGIFKVIDEDRFLSKKDTLITCHSFEDGSEQWRVELPKPLISQLIVVDEKLFLIEESGTLWCLAISTGQVLWQEVLHKGWLVEYQGLLYSARHNNISIINPETLSIQTLNCTASMKPKGLEFSWNGFGVEGEYLYFIDNGRPRVGLIHLPTATVSWFTDIEIPEGEYHILEVKMKANRLYVLVQGGNLHIFEKVETA